MRRLVLVLALMSAVSCGDSGDSPAAPTPTLGGQTVTLSGVVSETVPTESTLIAGATITAVAGLDGDSISTTSDAGGQYQLTGLAPGNYTVRAQAQNYTESSQPLALTRSQALAVRLDPVRQMVTTTRQDAISASGACEGPWDPGTACEVDYVLNVHHAGTLTAEVLWTDREVGFFTTLYRAERGRPSGQHIEARAVDNSGRRAVFDLTARTQYVIQVHAYTDTYMTTSRVTPYTVTLTHPN
jgi:carboxypeptidase family protein